jgi:acylphosphatase
MPESDSASIRRTVHFSGHVQGVGFRYTTQSIAAAFDITGFVRNLPDGRVELVAEGARGEVDRLQRAIHDAMDAHIAGIDTAERDATGEFTSFLIAF